MIVGSPDRKGIVTGGTWCADHNKFVSHWPGEEEVVEILTNEVRGGGSACNLGIDLKRLDNDIPVSTIGLIGDDEDGRILIAEADAAGIERSGLVIAKAANTAHTDAFTAADTGRRTHLYLPGTAAQLCPDHFEFSETQARFLHLGLPGVHPKLDRAWDNDENGWVTVLKKAQAAGLATNLELCSIPASRIAELVRPCLAHLDLLIVNDFEIAAISGHETSPGTEVDVQQCLTAARKVLAIGSMQMVVAHFPAGAVAVSSGGAEILLPSVNIPPGEIKGTNGAGDAFAAGVLYGLHQDWGMEEAVRLGHASAAASVRGLGTTDTVVAWRDCLTLASNWGWRKEL
ncbi:MAG: carbohydrate kinase family protein [Rhodobacteraceae bacterium]|nr:carbohydrate kinase family protein [Paracoccaceae bacterium]